MKNRDLYDEVLFLSARIRDILDFSREHQSESSQNAGFDSFFDSKNPHRFEQNSDSEVIKILYYDYPEILSKMQFFAERNGAEWFKDIVAQERKSPFYDINRVMKKTECSNSFNARVPLVSGKSLGKDLHIIKHYKEFGGVLDWIETYHRSHTERDNLRSKLFGLIADGKTNYEYSDLREFYFMTKEEKERCFCDFSREDDEWKDVTDIVSSDGKFSGYQRGMAAIEKRILEREGMKSLSETEKDIMFQQSRNPEILKLLIGTGQSVNLPDLMKRFSAKDALAIIAAGKCLQKQVSGQEIVRKADVDIALDFENSSDNILNHYFKVYQKLIKEKKLFTENYQANLANVEMLCKLYHYTDNPEIKHEMLEGLYNLRKGSKENCNIAGAIKNALKSNPELQKDENLVALSKVDTIFSQPTKTVKKQIEHSN